MAVTTDPLRKTVHSMSEAEVITIGKQAQVHSQLRCCKGAETCLYAPGTSFRPASVQDRIDTAVRETPTQLQLRTDMHAQQRAALISAAHLCSLPALVVNCVGTRQNTVVHCLSRLL